MVHKAHLVVPVNEQDHSQGPANALVTLVQYGDYECPYTRQSTTGVRAIQQQLGAQLRFVYRNFPLTEIHPHALHSAEAAEAAAAQGKFWEMHDYIFHHQHTLEDADLERFADAVGLNSAQFEQAMVQHQYIQRIEADLESGEQSGVQGTPTFFINGIRHDGSWEQAVLLAAIEKALQA
jgi:protein-disulfide isomerase